MTKKGVITALIIGAVLMLGWALMPKAEWVSIVEVKQGHFAETVRDEGRTHLNDTYTIAVPINGFLRRVELNAGDSVTAGQPVFHVEPLPTPALDARSREQAREALTAARARVEAAGAELENRIAEAEFARNELNRFQQLAQEGAVSATELDRATNTVQRTQSAERAARATLGATQAELENARLVLAITEGTRSSTETDALAIPAPISGVVLRRFRCCEGVVSAGERILELGDLSELEVRIDLLSQDAVRVKPGMRVEIDRWGGAHRLNARIRLVDPAGFTKVSALGIEEQRVAVYATLERTPESESKEWQQLGEGYRVQASIVLWERDHVNVVPVSALFRRDDQWHLFTVENGRAQLKQVTPGRRSGIYTQLVEGPAAGTEVVNHPPASLQHGDRVKAL